MLLETVEEREKKLRETNKKVYAELREKAARQGLTVREYQKLTTVHRTRKFERARI